MCFELCRALSFRGGAPAHLASVMKKRGDIDDATFRQSLVGRGVLQTGFPLAHAPLTACRGGRCRRLRGSGGACQPSCSRQLARPIKLETAQPQPPSMTPSLTLSLHNTAINPTTHCSPLNAARGTHNTPSFGDVLSRAPERGSPAGKLAKRGARSSTNERKGKEFDEEGR